MDPNHRHVTNPLFVDTNDFRGTPDLIKVTILLQSTALADAEQLADQRAKAAPAILARLEATNGAHCYAQHQRLPAGQLLAGAGANAFTGAEEYWFDTVDTARRFFSRPNAHGLEGQSAVELSKCLELSGTVYPIWDCAPQPTKILAIGARKPGLTVDGYRHHRSASMRR
jgi:hypothetical protein